MSIRCGSLLLPALLVVPLSLSASGCADDTGVDTVIGATNARAPFVNRLTSVSPPRVQAVVLPNATCPQLPFVAPFTLFVGAGNENVFLTGMNMQFIDHRNVPGPQTFLTHTALGERFGSTSVPPLESRSFPFEFSFGCGVVPPGTLTIVVFTEDEQRRERRTTLEVAVD